MAKTLNFNSIKREYFTVTLPDEDKTSIMISTPTKDLLGKIISLSSSMNIDNNDITEVNNLLDDLYGTIAKIMSCNKGGIVITKEKLESCLGFDDLITFFREYLAFVNNIKNIKN